MATLAVPPRPVDPVQPITVMGADGREVPAPVFPGWVALGRVPGTVVQYEDALVQPCSKGVYLTPETGYNEWVKSVAGKALGDRHLGPLSSNWCLYRPIRWRQITDPVLLREKPQVGDVLLRIGLSDPSLVPHDGKGNQYGVMVVDPLSWSPMVAYGGQFTIWRKDGGAEAGNGPTGPYIKRLPGNRHHSEVAPLP